MKLSALMISLCIFGLPYASALESVKNVEGIDAEDIFKKAALKCPGLEKYKNDYLNVSATANGDVFYDGSYQTSLKSLKIKIKENPEDIPEEFRASGHTCEYTFTKSEDRIIIMKDSCISICEGQLIENNGNNYEKK